MFDSSDLSKSEGPQANKALSILRIIAILIGGAILIGLNVYYVEGQTARTWRVSSERNPIDEVETVTATIPSMDMARHGRPLLVVRLRGRDLDVYVSTSEIVDEEQVRFRIDAAKPVIEYWGTAKGMEALFSPEPLDLFRKLRTAKNFYIEFHPYDRTARTIRFALPQRFPATVSLKIEAAEREREKQAKLMFALKQYERNRLLDRCKAFVGGPAYEWPKDCEEVRLQLEGNAIVLPNLAK